MGRGRKWDSEIKGFGKGEGRGRLEGSQGVLGKVNRHFPC